jgi:hypoxanthine phosphoribosyltransferase
LKLAIPSKPAAGKEFALLYAQNILARRIAELGREISKDYTGKNPVLVGVLKGCIVFMADLIRHISIPIELEFINASSYNGGFHRDSTVKLGEEPEISFNGRHVLVVEGVVDSGNTANKIMNLIRRQEPASVEIVTLLDKTKCREVAVDIKYSGFDAEDHFVIGYGLDKDQKYRNLPFIGRVLNED